MDICAISRQSYTIIVNIIVVRKTKNIDKNRGNRIVKLCICTKYNKMKYILVFTFALGILPNILAAGENDIGALAKEISNNCVALFERETHSPDD